MSESVNRNRMFDSIKGIAMIGIFIVHMGSWNTIVPIDSNWMKFIYQGSLGVELTYLVNAFFFTNSYNKKIRNGQDRIVPFLSKMFIRVIPVYWLALILNASIYLSMDAWKYLF